MTSKPQAIYIDGDILVYRALITSEHEICLNDDEGEPSDVWAISCDLGKAKTYFTNAVNNIVQGRPYYICLTDRSVPCFRKGLYPDYKMNRSSKRKPIGMAPFREWIEEDFKDKVVIRPGLEADDVLGIMQTNPNSPYEGIIWSVDKDMKTIPGLTWIEGNDPELITDAVADHYMFTQALTGDQVDNYPGIPGIGPKKAEKLLEGVARVNLWEKVKQAFIANGLTEEDALTQVRLARILRFDDWNKDKQEVILWTP